jgi:hypothetical protein
LDLDEMIHNLEVERRRIEEALEVLRRLHQIRKPSILDAQESKEEGDAIADPHPERARVAKPVRQG